MQIRKTIRLRNINYYIEYVCEYKKVDNILKLCLKDLNDNYYDGGDLSILIKQIEDNYNIEYVKKYDGNVWLMSDLLYIYESIPFITGLGDYYISPSDKVIDTVSYLDRKELDEYIKGNDIQFNYNVDFKLSNKNTWLVNKEKS